MRTFEEAKSLVGSKEFFSYAGGRSRYMSWDSPAPGAVTASIYGNVVATFLDDGRVIVTTHGRNTPSTFDALSHALQVPRGGRLCGTEKKVPYLRGREIVNNKMTLHP